jgi:prevent-host-death family protein
MTEISSFEARTHFSDLLRRVSQGEQFMVTVRGKPVACLQAATAVYDAAKLQGTFDELRAFRARIAERGGVLNAGESYKDLAREGLRS